jgi:hypothetical protein
MTHRMLAYVQVLMHWAVFLEGTRDDPDVVERLERIESYLIARVLRD